MLVMRSCGGGPVVGAVSRRCSAGAGEGLCVSVGCGLAILTLSGRAPHMTAGSSTGSSSLIGMNGEFPSSPSDLVLSNASKDNSVNKDDCSQEDSFS